MLNPHIRDHARLEGYTLEIIASGGAHDLTLYVKPDADLDGQFRAICAHEGHTLTVSGWLFAIETFDFLAAA